MDEDHQVKLIVLKGEILGPAKREAAMESKPSLSSLEHIGRGIKAAHGETQVFKNGEMAA